MKTLNQLSNLFSNAANRSSVDIRCAEYIEAILALRPDSRELYCTHDISEPEWPAILGYDAATDSQVWRECASQIMLHDWMESNPNGAINDAALRLILSPETKPWPWPKELLKKKSLEVEKT